MKPSDDPVEDQAVVEALLSPELDEVIYGIRGDLRIKLGFDDVAVFHFDGYDWILCHNCLLVIAKNYSKLALLLSIVSEKWFVFKKIQKNGYFFVKSCDTLKSNN